VALISGWLLTFTLSIDDLVIASFVSSPGSSTLPMVIFCKVKLGVNWVCVKPVKMRQNLTLLSNKIVNPQATCKAKRCNLLICNHILNAYEIGLSIATYYNMK
jgi:hypothetical protein